MTTPESTSAPTQATAAPSVALKTAKPAKAPAPLTSVAAKKTTVRKVPVKVAEKKLPTVSKAAPLKPASTPAPLNEKNAKLKKPKLVRDSFTIPKDEYAAIEMLKERAAALAHPIKKSELLRAGLKVLAGMSDAALRNALQAVPLLKTGRPKTETVPPVAATKSSTKSPSKK